MRGEPSYFPPCVHPKVRWHHEVANIKIIRGRGRDARVLTFLFPVDGTRASRQAETIALLLMIVDVSYAMHERRCIGLFVASRLRGFWRCRREVVSLLLSHTPESMSPRRSHHILQ